MAKITAAPASDGAVSPHPAGVDPPGADGGEGTAGWRGLTNNIALDILVEAPAFDGAASPHPAGVDHSGTDGGEGTAGWRGLTNNIPVVEASSLAPQHWTEPSVLTPQVWKYPAPTEAKEPPGGVA